MPFIAALPVPVAEVGCWASGCMRCCEISTPELEKCLRMRVLWLLIARLEGPSESNKTHHAASSLCERQFQREL